MIELIISITIMTVISGILMAYVAPLMGNSTKSIKYAFFGCTTAILPNGGADVAKCTYESFDPKGIKKTITNTMNIGYDRKKNPLKLDAGKEYQVA